MENIMSSMNVIYGIATTISIVFFKFPKTF